MRIGDFELTPLLDGYFRLDGGAMFGVVPKTAPTSTGSTGGTTWT